MTIEEQIRQEHEAERSSLSLEAEIRRDHDLINKGNTDFNDGLIDVEDPGEFQDFTDEVLSPAQRMEMNLNG